MTNAVLTTCHLRIAAPHFVAGVTLFLNPHNTWECLQAAPIVQYMVGMTYREIRSYCANKGWDVETLREAPSE